MRKASCALKTRCEDGRGSDESSLSRNAEPEASILVLENAFRSCLLLAIVLPRARRRKEDTRFSQTASKPRCKIERRDGVVSGHNRERTHAAIRVLDGYMPLPLGRRSPLPISQIETSLYFAIQVRGLASGNWVVARSFQTTKGWLFYSSKGMMRRRHRRTEMNMLTDKTVITLDKRTVKDFPSDRLAESRSMSLLKVARLLLKLAFSIFLPSAKQNMDRSRCVAMHQAIRYKRTCLSAGETVR